MLKDAARDDTGPIMNLRTVDLNLLVIFDTLIDERSVSRTAVRLGLTQSAVSHALRRLRAVLDDDLLVRSGGQMQPTAAALRIAAALRPALSQIHDVLNEKRSFDLRTTTRSFVLRVSEYVAPSVLAPLCTVMRAEAPGLKLSVVPFDSTTQDWAIEPGEIHLRVRREDRAMARPSSMRLFEDDFVVLLAENHACAGAPLTLDRYVSLPHLKVTADAVGTNMIDDALRKLGLVRNIVLTVPSWFEMRRVIAGTDLIAVVPRHWADNAAFSAGCVGRDLPLRGIALSVELVWHPRDTSDMGHAWLRALIARQFTAGAA